jgi:MoaA/NifB/PqqE/SkfB family radical SAM enzyme
MNAATYLAELLPKTINYWFARKKLTKNANPITLTFSVTGMCQSNCKTCYIGREFRKNPRRIKDLDLKIGEIEKFFISLGRIYFLNISGGEPYLRDDLPQIIELGMKYLRPKIIHIPTNAFLPRRIERLTRDILNVMGKYNSGIPLTVKPSIDGLGEKHDEIRGLEGNFERLEETIHLLKAVENDYSNFHLELGTVVSNYNINDLDEIEDWVHSQGVQSYRNEIAEQREEFFNIGEDITPSDQDYERLMVNFKKKVEENLQRKRSLTKMTESIRLVYYDLAVKILKEKKQVISCYAGITNIHLNYDGDIWPCCVLGYAHSMGNIRCFNFDYKALYNSKRAQDVREYIRNGRCYCPLANQAYSNILMNARYLTIVLHNYLKCAVKMKG